MMAAVQSDNRPVKPFLKWAGNKLRIIDRIRRLLPSGERLVEPFAGSGAVFLNTEFDSYLLSDSNADLIALYQILRDEGEPFIDHCRGYFQARNNTAERYYAIRERFNASDAGPERAAMFLYLNRHGYNGLCRYNSKGGFNVPFGRYKRPYFPAPEMLAFHGRAQRAEFRHEDFRHTIATTGAGDVIYCDPPYVPLSLSANFTRYSREDFGLELQSELAQLAGAAAARGVPVLVSNHNTAFTRRAYREARISRFQVQRFISCNGQQRTKAGELLALFQ